MTLNENNVNVDTTTGKFQMGGEKVSDLFNNLVIPNWSLSYNYKHGPLYEGGGYGLKKHNGYDPQDEDDFIEEDLHEKLLNLVKVDKTAVKNNKKNTKKHLHISNKKTKNRRNGM
jgi:hypothetical protein